MIAVINRFSRQVLSLLLLVSLIANIVLLLSSTAPCGDGAIGEGQQSVVGLGGGSAQKQCPVCKPCDGAAAAVGNEEKVNVADKLAGEGAPKLAAAGQKQKGGDIAADVVPDNAEVAAAAVANFNGYKTHGLRSEYDPSSPVHTIIDVAGVGKMIGVVSPVWRLVPATAGGAAASIADDVPAPGQVVTEAEKEEPPAAAAAANNETDTARKLLSSAEYSVSGSQQRRAPHEADSMALWMPKDVTRISIDVGTFLTSPSSKRWWYWDGKAMVVAFEPNIVSGMLLTRISHPAFNTQLHGYWPACALPRLDPTTNVYTHDGPIDRGVQLENLNQCINKSYGHITSRMDRFVLFPVALSSSDSFANFQYGFPGRADSGSLLPFNRQMIKKRQGARPLFALPTPVMRMASVLALIPKVRADGTPILWDTLKIDAQGVDSLIIEGAGHLLRNFACVLGEFDASSYKGARKFDYRAYLVFELGFIMLRRTTFVNPAFAEVVHSKRALCFSSDVAVDYGQLGKAMLKLRHEGKLPKQREHPELSPIDRG